MISRSIVATLLVCGLLSAFGSTAQDDVKIEATQVRGNIYMLTGQGGNIGLFNGTDGSFMIDDQFEPLTEKILAAVESTGGKSPRMLLNTHYHGDHTGGNENIGNTGTLIMSHKAVRERLARGSYLQAFDMKSPPASAAALPVITYTENMHLHLNGENVHIIHMPLAHTDGDSVVLFEKANVVHAGDLFFNGFYPFIDGTHGGTLRGTIDGVDQILAMTDADSKIIPGHGPLGDRAQLQAYRDMLVTAFERLLELKSSGLGVEEIVKRKPLADLEAEWGDGLMSGDKWIEATYAAIY